MSVLSTSKPPKANRRHLSGAKYCVLVAGPGECFALEMESGVLVRSTLPGSVQAMCSPFEVIDATKSSSNESKDPSRPESIRLNSNVLLTGKRLRRRRAHRLIKPVLAPKSLPLLGFRGPAASYWTLSGNHPSVTIVSPDRGPLLLSRSDGTVWVRFGLGRNVEELPLIEPRIIATVKASSKSRITGKQLFQLLGWKPKFIVVALAPPQEGYCYKTVVGFLP